MRACHLVLVSVVALAAGCASRSATDPQYEENPVNHEVSADDRAATKSTAPVSSDKVVLWVNGLGCPLCATNADRQLKRMKGVASVDTDISTGKITVMLSSSLRPSPAQFGEAVEDAGFTLMKVEQQ
ncbi:MAG: heavy-metal-associated domain-containing protein [Phycisphaerales bacterium]